MSTQTTHYVDSGDALAHALDSLTVSEFVAVDTEFMRESTYYPKLCLVQLATLEYCAIIDPFAFTDLQTLWAFLADRSRVKVLHAARQDLEVLAVDAPNLSLGPIFDTQIAAAMLGQSAQIGYGALVTLRLEHTLAKGHTRADWSKRPLSHEQLDYAADDVRYLAPLYVDLRAALERENRLDWMHQETRPLERLDINKTEPQNAWRRLKGLDRLRPEQRAVAKLLAQWREELAIKHDKPRGWILADEALREIVERMPTDNGALEQVRSLPAGVVRRRGAELLQIVQQGIDAKDTEAGVRQPTRPEPEQLALVTKLMNFVRAYADGMRISPELLATRRDIEHFVFSGATEHLLAGWRGEVIGAKVIAMGKGEAERS
jgi:ribonuclease D